MIDTASPVALGDPTSNSAIYLVRYGTTPEVARCAAATNEPWPRGTTVVVQTHRGLQLGAILERLKFTGAPPDTEFEVLRAATADDLTASAVLQRRCEAEFPAWERRINEWGLHLELIDLERTLDDAKLILYVLTERGPDATQLALQAAAAGLGILEVQPVGADGPVMLSSGGGCGSGGCGCEH